MLQVQFGKNFAPGDLVSFSKAARTKGLKFLNKNLEKKIFVSILQNLI